MCDYLAPKLRYPVTRNAHAVADGSGAFVDTCEAILSILGIHQCSVRFNMNVIQQSSAISWEFVMLSGSWKVNY